MKDINTHSIAGRRNETFWVPLVPFVEGNADGLKVSSSESLIIIADEVHGGREDVLDVNNHCRHVAVEILEAHANGKFAVTIKGGSLGILVKVGKLIGRGSEVDIDFGNRSDQSDNPTSDCVVHIESTDDDRPVRWRSINARRCKVTGGPGVRIKKVFALPSWLGSIIQKVWDFFAK